MSGDDTAPAVPQEWVEAAAEAMRGSRLRWGTHSDQWCNANWQESFWREAATTVLAAVLPAVREAVRREVAEEIAAAREAAWAAYLNGPGGLTEALRQGRFDGLNKAAHIARATADPKDTR